jgi:hypothetical protein
MTQLQAVGRQRCKLYDTAYDTAFEEWYRMTQDAFCFVLYLLQWLEESEGNGAKNQ